MRGMSNFLLSFLILFFSYLFVFVFSPTSWLESRFLLFSYYEHENEEVSVREGEGEGEKDDR